MRIRVPTHPAQPSLNLAQAVLLIAYELRLAALPEAPPETPRPARAGGRVERRWTSSATRCWPSTT